MNDELFSKYEKSVDNVLSISTGWPPFRDSLRVAVPSLPFVLGGRVRLYVGYRDCIQPLDEPEYVPGKPTSEIRPQKDV